MGDLLEGRVAVVTGAGNGLGRAEAIGLAAQGAYVVVNDIGTSYDGIGVSNDPADLVVETIINSGGTAVPNYATVATEEGAKNIIQTALDCFGRIDVLINNAGIIRNQTVYEIPTEDWEAVIKADSKDVAESVKSGGLGDIKADRIKAALIEIQAQKGNFDLSFLGELPPSEAKDWLTSLPGVGPKTAACVLLFALGEPAFPVDTHVFRLARRLGLINSKVNPERAEEVLEKIVPANKVYQAHLHLIEHGRKVCHAQRPRCDRCVLAELCPSAS